MSEFSVSITEATGGYIVQEHDTAENHVTNSREGVGKIIKGLCDTHFGESRVKDHPASTGGPRGVELVPEEEHEVVPQMNEGGDGDE